MSEEHQKQTIGWDLYLHSESPVPPGASHASRPAPHPTNPGRRKTAQQQTQEKAYGAAPDGRDVPDTPGM